MTDILLDYLEEAEGIEIHRLSTEDDITSPYGIYRKHHSDASIFTYIDELASSLDLDIGSEYWDEDMLEEINNIVDKDHMRELAKDFYSKFIEDLNLDLFTSESIIAAFSLYTNSPKLLWKSVQSTINKFNSNNFISYLDQPVDGYFGSKTSNGLKMILELTKDNRLYGYIFEAYMISHMQLEYSRLAVSNQNKYLKYLNGWNNRVTKLLNK